MQCLFSLSINKTGECDTASKWISQLYSLEKKHFCGMIEVLIILKHFH